MHALIQKLAASKVVRFGLIGGLGMPVNLVALAFAKWIIPVDVFDRWKDLAKALGMGWITPHLVDMAAWFVGFFVAVTFTWWGNRTFTFHEHKSSGHKGIFAEWVRFFLTNSLGAAANLVVYTMLLGLSPWPLSLVPANLRAYPALCVGVLVGLIFNYTLSKRLVFRAK